VIGRSEIVGKPVALLLLKEDMTVTICHSKTIDLPFVVHDADVVIAALGKPGFVKGEWIKNGAIVIDVGINQVDGKLVGDVDFAFCPGKSLVYHTGSRWSRPGDSGHAHE
jgi:methylenetetrahydrofolate dehydrogenase (NADP+)/methenyltetrahydrofolate cyclohydrolase